jgi:translation initiation factor IF-1
MPRFTLSERFWKITTLCSIESLCLAHLSKSLAEAKICFVTGERVVLELTAYDFDQARILRRV